MGIMTFSLYIFPSGLPQPSHLLMLIAFMLAPNFILKKTLNKKVSILLIIFLLYVTTRQLFYGIHTSIIDTSTMLPPLYLIFNLLLFFTTITFTIYNNVERYVKYGIILSLFITVLGIFYYGFSLNEGTSDELAYRAIGTFNNPNQLGYYAICMGGLVVLLAINNIIPLILSIILLGIVLFLTMLSLSKAAMVSVVVYLLYFAKGNKKILLFLFFLILLILLTRYEDIEGLKFIDRLSKIGSAGDDNLEHRGYGVLFNPDIRLFYGWGEGYTKAGHEGGGIGGHFGEVHSTLGTVLIGYGLIGLFIFVQVLWTIYIKAYKAYGFIASFALFMPFMLYGLTHNGLRFSIFWIFLGLIYALSLKKINEKRMGLV